MSRTSWALELPVGLGVGGGPLGFSVRRSAEGRSNTGSAEVEDFLNHFTKAWGAHKDREGISPPSPDSGPLLCPHATCPAGRGKPEVVSVVGRAGESAVLGCDLLSPAGRPPLHVIEWLRFGFLLPIFIQFGLYSPRIDPAYVGKAYPQVGGREVSPTKVDWVEWEQVLFLTALSLSQTHLQLHCLNSA